MEMILAVDIGNSSIKSGVFNGRELAGIVSMPTHPAKSVSFYKEKLRGILSKNDLIPHFDWVILSSVVPELTGKISASTEGLTGAKPLILGVHMKTGLRFGIRKPEELGSDRIAGAVAAMEVVGPTVVVVDFGTATTLSAIKNGRYIGGAILPGLGTIGQALHEKASKLPLAEVPMRPSGVRMSPAGKDTKACIISGIIYGTAGAVERLIGEMESGEGCRFKVVTTGGYSGVMAPYLRRKHRNEPYLILKGLRSICEMNR